MKSSERNIFVGSKESLKPSESTSSVNGLKSEEMSKDLPSEFVNYLRSLFDILDQEKCGFVKITDIETYWDAKGSSFSGVLDSLKQLSPPSGLLNFEDLCRGLKLAIRSSNNSNTNTADRTSSDLPKETEYTSDSSEDSFKVYGNSKESELSSRLDDAQQKSSSREQLDSLPVSLSNSNLTHVKTNSNSKVYFVGKESGDGLRGGSKLGPPSIDKKTRSTQVEEELEILKNGLTVIEKARKWYFRRITAVQEEKLHLLQSDQTSLEQFQYEMLLHNNRRKELNLTEASFRCYKRNIEELNNYVSKLVENPLEPLPPPRPVEAPKPPPEYIQQLRDDLYAKNNRISQLEREKSALIRDLFNAKASISSGVTKIPPDKE